MIRIGSRLMPTDPYWVLVREMLHQHVQEAGVVLVNVNLALDTVCGEAQLSLLENLLAQELDALITPRLPEPLARRIVAAGLPLIFSDEMEYSAPGMTSPRGLDEAAALAARFVLERIDCRGTVVIVGGEQRTLATVQRRVDGFQQPLARHPQVRCVQIPALWRHDEAYDQIMEEADRWRQALGPAPLAAIYGLSDSLALGGRDALRRLGLVDACTQIVGINGDPLAVAAIIEGSMHATVETSAWDLARRMLDYACRAAGGEALPPHFPYGQRLVTAANAAQVAAETLVSMADLPTRLVNVNVRLEQQRLVQMQTSLELNRRVGSILDEAELLRELAGIIRSRYDFDHAEFYWLRDGDCCLLHEQPGVPEAQRRRLPLDGAGPLGQALLHNQPIYIPDTLTGARFAPDPFWPETRSRVILPIHSGSKTLGLLDLHSRKRSPRSQLVIDALQTLADEVGIALRNAQLYAQALAAKAEAERANLLKSRLLANVSHELRTPLNIILGYSQTALDDPNPYGVPLHPELVHDLRHIQRSGQHLVRLIDDLLNLAQAESGALEIYPQQMDVGALLAEVLQAVAGAGAQPAVAWRLQLPAILPPLYADPVRLRQVLLNLLSNAARFTTQGHIVLGAHVAGETLQIWVEDTGTGISAEEQARLLAPAGTTVTTEEFVSGMRAQHGAGLGLQVAQHLVALHQGTLAVQSRAGHGSIFRITLPLQPGAQARAPEPEPPVAGGPQSSERLLQMAVEHASELSRGAVAYMAEHYAGSLSRDEISEALRVSPNHLTRVFRRDIGLTPWQYLSHYRVLQAQKLLVGTELSVTEIAERVGFNDPAYFVRVFHKESGQAPLQYRKNTK